ncbi:right-handed parallel beta-helix repeat-containing protein [Lentzea sp. NPDC058436]|uniref:right-handed parallel beta-helix repeat-containing protein n=1 Tax=Lentzea sp. NPDC058436 TaxID=3346499 RepID=UPI00365064AF
MSARLIRSASPERSARSSARRRPYAASIALAGVLAFTAACGSGKDVALPTSAPTSDPTTPSSSTSSSSAAPSSSSVVPTTTTTTPPKATGGPPKPPAPPVGAPGAGTVPAPGSVGFRGDAAALKVIDGPGNAPAGTKWNAGQLQVVANDLVLDGVSVKGGITFQGGGTLTIRNSIVEGNRSSQSAVLGLKGHLDISDSTLRWKAGDTPGNTWGNGAVHGDSTMTLRRNDISGTPDGIQNGPGRSLIEQNWIHDLARIGTYPNNTHNDGIQSYGGPDLIIRNNRIDIEGPDGVAYDGTHQNGAVFVQPGGGGASNLQVVGNFLAGGGYIMRLEGPISGAVVTDNKFGPTTGGWGEVLVEKNVAIASWSNNTSDSGKAVNKPS